MNNWQNFAVGFVNRWGNFLTDFDSFYQKYKNQQNQNEFRKSHPNLEENNNDNDKKELELLTHSLEHTDNTMENQKKSSSNDSQPINQSNEPQMIGEAITEVNHSSGKEEEKLQNDVPVQKKKKLVRLKEKENNELREKEIQEREEKENEENILKKKIRKERKKKKLLDTDDSDLDFKIKKKAKNK